MSARSLPASLVLVTGLALGCSRSTAEAERREEPPRAASGGLLRAGTPAPAVVFAVQSGETVELAKLKGQPVVVYFYPKDDTPGCTVEAQEIRDLYTEIRGTGATVIGVSADGLESHRAFADKHQLPFLLAADESGDIARAFGVTLNAAGRAQRVTFVVGRDGVIQHVFPDVQPKGHAAELLTALKT